VLLEVFGGTVDEVGGFSRVDGRAESLGVGGEGGEEGLVEGSHDGIYMEGSLLIIMGCVEPGKNVGLLRVAGPGVDQPTKKRQALVEYALRHKIHGILEVVNAKEPFEVVKELSLSTDVLSRRKRPERAREPRVLSGAGEAGLVYL
jgi:hypothetical protein